MKRLWTLAAFALLACAGLATPTQAGGSFGLFYCGRHCNQCAVCIRPYNAFTPVLCGDVTGYGGCGQGGCGYGGCSPIGCPCGYGCGQGGCGYGNCGYGNCGYGSGQGGYGNCGQGGCHYGWGPHHGLANVNPLRDTGYTGALGYSPPDGLGNGAFGTVGLGRLSVYGNPACGGGCAGGFCKQGAPMMNTFAPAPMACGPQGCAPVYGFGMDFGAPTFATSATPTEGQPSLLQIPKDLKIGEAPAANTAPVSPAQPVSYLPYPAAGQQMVPYGYTQPAWGYPAYRAPTYPTWGYRGW